MFLSSQKKIYNKLTTPHVLPQLMGDGWGARAGGAGGARAGARGRGGTGRARALGRAGGAGRGRARAGTRGRGGAGARARWSMRARALEHEGARALEHEGARALEHEGERAGASGRGARGWGRAGLASARERSDTTHRARSATAPPPSTALDLRPPPRRPKHMPMCGA